MVRNCLHGGNIYFYEVDGGKLHYLKTSTYMESIQDLSNEHSGWTWYANKVGLDSDELTSFDLVTKNYARLWIQKFNGKKVSYAEGLKKKAAPLKLISDHYLAVWGRPSTELYPLHGDLSLDNIIVTRDSVRFIDWEHFKDKACPWGFDLFYLFFETYWFNSKMLFFNKKRSLLSITDAFIYLAKFHKIPQNYLLNPLSRVISFIKENYSFWGHQLTAYPMKLPILRFSNIEINLIDDFINSQLIVKENELEKILSN